MAGVEDGQTDVVTVDSTVVVAPPEGAAEELTGAADEDVAGAAELLELGAVMVTPTAEQVAWANSRVAGGELVRFPIVELGKV